MGNRIMPQKLDYANPPPKRFPWTRVGAHSQRSRSAGARVMRSGRRTGEGGFLKEVANPLYFGAGFPICAACSRCHKVSRNTGAKLLQKSPGRRNRCGADKAISFVASWGADWRDTGRPCRRADYAVI